MSFDALALKAIKEQCRENKMQKKVSAEHLARQHARMVLQEQTLFEPVGLTNDELLAYRLTLYRLADEVVGYKTE